MFVTVFLYHFVVVGFLDEDWNDDTIFKRSKQDIQMAICKVNTNTKLKYVVFYCILTEIRNEFFDLIG